MATFAEILRDAVADIAIHGYDDRTRVDKWLARLREAARQSLVPETEMQRRLVQALGGTYRKHMRQVMKRHRGIDRYTLQQLQPSLHLELNRRVQASAQLITLNRDESIQRTLKRFEGWATAMPKGGRRNVDKPEAAAELKRSFASLPFEERRVVIDQGHKLIAALDDIIATDGGALAGVWHSHWREMGYDYRARHKEFDKRVFVLRNNWAMKQGLMKPAGQFYADQVEQPAQLPFCFPGDSRVPFTGFVESAYRRWYSGQLTTIITSTGKTLRATPNHPVLTPRGWVSVDALKEGDYVIEAADKSVGVEGTESDQDQAIPTIAQVFSALNKVGVIGGVRGSREQFHGDGAEGDVDTVMADGILLFDGITPGAKKRGQFGFADTYVTGTLRSTFELLRHWLFAPCQGLMGFLRAKAMLFRGLVVGHDDVGRLMAPNSSACLGYGFDDGSSGNIEGFGEREDAFSRLMPDADIVMGQSRELAAGEAGMADIDLAQGSALTQRRHGDAEGISDFLSRLPFSTKAARVVHIDNEQWAGHVYNLQTRHGFYVTEGILTHNCRCYYTYLYALGDLPQDMVTAKGRLYLQGERRAAHA